MPRVGCSIEEQRSGSNFRFDEGRGRIVSICATPGAREFNKEKCVVVVGIQRIGRDGKPTEDDVVLEECNFGPLSKFHPANAKDQNDMEPEDLGDEVGVEGNSILAIDGAFPDTKSKMSVFAASLQNAGVRPVLLTGYWPSILDLEADFSQIKLRYESLGTDGYNLIVKPGGNIYNLAEINKRAGGAATPNGKPATAPAQAAAKPKPQAASTTAPANDAGAGADDETEMLAIQLFAQLPGKKEAVLTAQKVGTRLMTVMVAQKPPLTPAQMRNVQKVTGRPGWAAEQAETMGWTVEGENITIPAAG